MRQAAHAANRDDAENIATAVIIFEHMFGEPLSCDDSRLLSSFSFLYAPTYYSSSENARLIARNPICSMLAAEQNFQLRFCDTKCKNGNCDNRRITYFYHLLPKNALRLLHLFITYHSSFIHHQLVIFTVEQKVENNVGILCKHTLILIILIKCIIKQYLMYLITIFFVIKQFFNPFRIQLSVLQNQRSWKKNSYPKRKINQIHFWKHEKKIYVFIYLIK